MNFDILRSSGAFITVDGAEGCGKSTMLRRAAEILEEAGVPVQVINSPDVNTGEGADVRRFILSREKPLSSSTEVYLFASGFWRSLDTYIIPFSLIGGVTLVDRWWYTTKVYQGIIHGEMPLVESIIPTVYVGHCISPEEIKSLETNFLLSVPDEVSRERRAKWSKGDVYDRQPEEFQQKVSAAYKSVFAEEQILSGLGTPDEVATNFLKQAIAALANRGDKTS